MLRRVARGEPLPYRLLVAERTAWAGELIAKEVGKNDGSFLPDEIRPKPR